MKKIALLFSTEESGFEILDSEIIITLASDRNGPSGGWGYEEDVADAAWEDGDLNDTE